VEATSRRFAVWVIIKPRDAASTGTARRVEATSRRFAVWVIIKRRDAASTGTARRVEATSRRFAVWVIIKPRDAASTPLGEIIRFPGSHRRGGCIGSLAERVEWTLAFEAPMRDPAISAELDRLAQEHAAAAFRVAQRILRDRGLAEDAAQDALLTALRRPATYLARQDGVEPGRALRWLAAKKALEQLRRGRARDALTRIDMTSDLDGRIASAATPDPSDEAQRREARAALRVALDRLPDDLRIALVLRFEEGFTLREVAAATAVSDKAVFGRVQSGIDRLRAALRTAGFGAAALAIEAELAAAPPPPLPEGLEARLAARIATPAPATPLAATLWIGGGVLAAAAVSFAAFSPFGRFEPPKRPGPATTVAAHVGIDPGTGSVVAEDPAIRVTADATAAEPESSGAPASLAATSMASIDGRVSLHPADTAALAHVRVVAISLRHLTKASTPRHVVGVDRAGHYRIEVPVESDGAYFKVFAEYDGATLASTPERRLRPGDDARGVDLAFDEPLGEREGHFDVVVAVQEHGGQPLASRHFTLYRRIGAPERDDEPILVRESYATSDASGSLRLAGSWLGGKRLQLDSGATVDFELASPGTELGTLRLGAEERTPGAASRYFVVTGRLEDAATHAPLLDMHHEVTLIAPPPVIDGIDLRLDWLPNAPWLDHPVQVMLGDDAVPTDRFEATTATSGPHYAVAWHRGYAPAVVGPIDIPADGAHRVPDVAIAFGKPAEVAGRIVAPDGNPVAGARVAICGLGPFSAARVAAIDDEIRKQSGQGYVHGSVAVTDAIGRFTIATLQPAVALRFVALHPDYAPAASGLVTLTAGPNEPSIELAFTTPREP
jgi:RNA polymerase sigma-70 factor (ECF subfamily)